MKRSLRLLLLSLLILTICAAPLDALAAKYKYTATTNSIKLSWNKISGASSYNLYFDMGSNPVAIKKKTTSLSHTVTKLSPGSSYWFMYEGNKKSGVSAPVYTAKICTLCSAPKGLAKYSESRGTVTLYWKHSYGATKYAVYQATSKNGTYKKLGTVTSDAASVYPLKAGKTYYYKVAAINENNKIGPKTSAIKHKAR